MGNKSSKVGASEESVVQTVELKAKCHEIDDLEAISFEYRPPVKSTDGTKFTNASKFTLRLIKKDGVEAYDGQNSFLTKFDISVDTAKRCITFGIGHKAGTMIPRFLTIDLSEECSEEDMQELLTMKTSGLTIRNESLADLRKRLPRELLNQISKPSMKYDRSNAVVRNDEDTISECSTNSESSDTEPSVRPQRLSRNATQTGLPPRPTFIDNQSCIIFQEQKTNDAEPRGRPTKPNALNVGQMQTIDEELELPAAPEIPSNAPNAPLPKVDVGIKFPKHVSYKPDENMVYHPEPVRPSLRNIFSNKENHEVSDASDETSSSHSESTPTPPKKQDVEPSKPQLGLAESYAVQPVTRPSFNPDAVGMQEPPQQRLTMSNVDQPSMAVFDENRGYNPEHSDSDSASTVPEIDRRRLVDNSTNVSNDTFTVLMLIPLLLLLVLIFKRFSESCVKNDAGKNDHDQEAEVDHNIV